MPEIQTLLKYDFEQVCTSFDNGFAAGKQAYTVLSQLASSKFKLPEGYVFVPKGMLGTCIIS